MDRARLLLRTLHGCNRDCTNDFGIRNATAAPAQRDIVNYSNSVKRFSLWASRYGFRVISRIPRFS